MELYSGAVRTVDRVNRSKSIHFVCLDEGYAHKSEPSSGKKRQCASVPQIDGRKVEIVIYHLKGTHNTCFCVRRWWKKGGNVDFGTASKDRLNIRDV